MRETLLNIINNTQGIKQVDLALKVYEQVHPKSYTSDTILQILENLVDEGEIIKLNYVLPHMHYREKSMYFPKDTKFTWGNK